MAKRPLYDWGAVFAYYASLEPGVRSYRAVQRHFGMGIRTIERHAAREQWERRVTELDEKAQARAEAKVVRARADRIADTLRVIDASRTRFAGQLTTSSFRLTGSDFVGLMKLEALLEGEVTDRCELGDVQAIVTAVFTAAARFVPADRRQEFMAELDGAVGGLVVIDGGKAAA